MQILIKKKDAVWNFIGTVLSMGANFIILPFVLLCLNDDAIAMYYIFSSLAGIAALFDFGFSPSMARSMAYAFSGVASIKKDGVETKGKAGVNYLLMNQLISTCKLIYFLLSSIALVIALSIGTIYVLKVSYVDHGTEYLVPWIIYAISIFLNILFGYYSVFLRGVGAVAEINMVSIISRVIQILLSIGLLLGGFGLYGVAIAYMLYGLVFRLVAKERFYKYQNIGENLKHFTKKVNLVEVKQLLMELWPNTWKDGLVTVSNYLVGQATTIIASMYISLTDTGVLSLCTQLVTAVATVAMVLLIAYQPAMQSAFANSDREKQKKYLSIVLVFYVVSFIIITIGLLIIGLPIIEMLKKSYEINVSLLLIVSLYYFILYLRNIYCSFISTTNRLIYYKSFVIASILCIIFQLLIGEFFDIGAYGIVAGQILSQIVFCAWFWPMFVHKEMEISFVEVVRYGVEGLKDLFKGKNKI